jgi:hypothetical protein
MKKLLVVLFAAGCSGVGESPLGRAQPLDHALAGQLAVLATGAPPTPALLEQARDATRYIDALLADPRFVRDLAISILLPTLHAPDGAIIEDYQLKQRSDAVYYLRQPCAARDAELVAPWWDLDHPVRICPDSYQPTHTQLPGGAIRCGSNGASPKLSTYCGCGANLIHCADAAHRAAFQQSLLDEVRETFADIIRSDAPLEQVYLQNETVRDRNAEFAERVWRIDAGENIDLSDLKAWLPHRARRHEVSPGQHAGLLTTPAFVFSSGAPRSRLRNYFNALWCEGVASKGASAQTLLRLGTANLAGDGWQKLAAMPLCTNCHARLDYGVRFFPGTLMLDREPWYRPTAARVAGEGPFYANDIHDLRARAELTPRSFAQVAVAQPEFASCVAQRVSEHVFAGEAPPEVNRELRETFVRSHSLRQVVRHALLRYVEQARAARPELAVEVPSEPTSGSPASFTARMAVPRDVREQLDRQCGRCHASGVFDFRGDTLPWSTLHSMLFDVAGHVMPRTLEGLSARDRDILMRGLAKVLWPDPAKQARALALVRDTARSLPAHASKSLGTLIDARVGARADKRVKFGAHEQYTILDRAPLRPGTVLSAGAQALLDCRAAGGDLGACLSRALTPQGLLNAPLK